MSSIKQDLSKDDHYNYMRLVSQKYGVPFGSITLGNLANTICLFHQTRFRSYGIGGLWRHDLCYPCFSRDIANGNVKQGGNKLARHGKSHWAQG